MSQNSLVSIVMPVYNAERHISQAIGSVLGQTYKKWELIIINDGSTDNSEQIVLQIEDARIRYFSQDNKGVSAARNAGLTLVSGDFICFLDADDMLSPDSLKARLRRFEDDPAIDFVDGGVSFFDSDTGNIKRSYKPQFKGNPLRELFLLNGKCFACPSWMIRVKAGKETHMREGLTHGEDMLYYMELAKKGGIYDFVDQEVLRYRQHRGSAMTNLHGLENAYFAIYSILKTWDEFTIYYQFVFILRAKKFMILDYVKKGDLRRCLSVLFR